MGSLWTGVFWICPVPVVRFSKRWDGMDRLDISLTSLSPYSLHLLNVSNLYSDAIRTQIFVIQSDLWLR